MGRVPGALPLTVLVTRLLVKAVRLDCWVTPETIHIGAPVGGGSANLKLFLDVGVDRPHVEENDLPERAAVDVELGQVVRAKQVFAIRLSTHGLEDGESLLLVLSDFLFVLAAGEEDAKQVGHLLVEGLNLEAHLGCIDWVGRDQLDAALWVALIGVLADDAAVGDQLTLR